MTRDKGGVFPKEPIHESTSAIRFTAPVDTLNDWLLPRHV